MRNSSIFNHTPKKKKKSRGHTQKKLTDSSQQFAKSTASNLAWSPAKGLAVLAARKTLKALFGCTEVIFPLAHFYQQVT